MLLKEQHTVVSHYEHRINKHGGTQLLEQDSALRIRQPKAAFELSRATARPIPSEPHMAGRGKTIAGVPTAGKPVSACLEPQPAGLSPRSPPPEVLWVGTRAQPSPQPKPVAGGAVPDRARLQMTSRRCSMAGKCRLLPGCTSSVPCPDTCTRPPGEDEPQGAQGWGLPRAGACAPVLVLLEHVPALCRWLAGDLGWGSGRTGGPRATPCCSWGALPAPHSLLSLAGPSAPTRGEQPTFSGGLAME